MYVDGEPAASLRVRWFATFIKLERAVVLKRYRSMGLFLPLLRWAMEFGRKKGYTKAYLHGQRRLWPIFERGGFHKVDVKTFHFSDHEYGAYACDLEVDEKTRPTVVTDPMVLNGLKTGSTCRESWNSRWIGGFQSACGVDGPSRELRGDRQ